MSTTATTTTASRDTGSEILSYCGSCKMDLGSVIIAKVGSKIARVQCKTCKKEHTYKPPKGATDPAAASAAKSSRSATRAANAEEEKRVSLHAEWTRLMSEASKAPRVKYSTKGPLQLGDVLEHPAFGSGIVMKLTFPDKAQVLFETDLKTLIHSKK